MPVADQQHLAEIVARRADDVRTAFNEAPTILIEEAGTAFLVTRADPDEVSLLLHALPGEIEIGVAEEPTYPLLSSVASLRTSGAPRAAGIVFDIARPASIQLFRQMISQPYVDLVVLDPESRFLAAYRFELTLFTRARAHRSLDQARRHLDSLALEKRSFRIAMDELQAYVDRTLTA
ncbi:MAG: hypothetical protein AAB074_15895 [Planctomycetota bacterium]